MKRSRVRIASLGLVFGYFAANWVEFAYAGIAVARVPDVPIGHRAVLYVAWR